MDKNTDIVACRSIPADYEGLRADVQGEFSLNRARYHTAGFCMNVPGSKSITNRALLIASLASGISSLLKVPGTEEEGGPFSKTSISKVFWGEAWRGTFFQKRFSPQILSPKYYSEMQDTDLMREACERLGAKFRQEGDCTELVGCNGKWKRYATPLNVGNAGTCARFLAVALLRGEGDYHLTGSPRMQERPMGDLIRAMRSWGASIEASGTSLPLTIQAGPIRGGELLVSGERSSQFLSALLMIAPFAEHDSTITIEGPLVSPTYVDMTMAVMRHFGVRVSKSGQHFHVPAKQCYRASTFSIPGDASSASYFFALAAITGLRITVENLPSDPPQSDLGFATILSKMGCRVERDANSLTVEGTRELQGLDLDMCDMSDVVPSLVVVALFAKSSTTIRNVAHMRHKECDRLRALRQELSKFAKIEERADGLIIEPLTSFPTESIDIETYEDHRIAMAFTVLSVRIPRLRILNPSCVAKTYPTFFRDLKRACHT
ncbi:MAG: 3-phosphoshikimate 1-carboxyvinyltransferase [Deltaproteobacteria bacterium]|nr:3-phosphoshikimate 1-carboxyvinyltransferase [Deltaproteobacteria bacterium]